MHVWECGGSIWSSRREQGEAIQCLLRAFDRWSKLSMGRRTEEDILVRVANEYTSDGSMEGRNGEGATEEDEVGG